MDVFMFCISLDFYVNVYYNLSAIEYTPIYTAFGMRYFNHATRARWYRLVLTIYIFHHR